MLSMSAAVAPSMRPRGSDESLNQDSQLAYTFTAAQLSRRCVPGMWRNILVDGVANAAEIEWE